MKTAKRTFEKLVVLVLALSAITSVSAQHTREEFHKQKEKIEAHKVAFLTDRLDLSPGEAEKFWPVYNKHREKIENERKQFREAHDYKPSDIETMSDEEANTFLNDQIAHEQKMLNYREELIEALRNILPPQKILILNESEREFKVQLMKRVARHKNPPGK